MSIVSGLAKPSGIAAAGGAVGLGMAGATDEAQAAEGPPTRDGYRNYTLPGGFVVKSAPEDATAFDLAYSFYKTSGTGKERARRLIAYNRATLNQDKANRQTYEALLRKEAAKYDRISEQLVLAITQQESSFNSYAISEAGAMGLMQLTEIHWGKGQFNPFEPEQNIKAGVSYLNDMLDMFKGDMYKAVAAYNTGPTNLRGVIRRYGDKWKRHLNSETSKYLRDLDAFIKGTNEPTMDQSNSSGRQP